MSSDAELFTDADVELLIDASNAFRDLGLTFAAVSLMDLARRVCEARNDPVGAERFPTLTLDEESFDG